MSGDTGAGAAVAGSLSNASVERLACLLRHWTWADEALVRFDRELAEGGTMTPIRCRTVPSDPSTTGVRCCARSPKRRSSVG
jgi:hypothetical protein